MCVCVCVCTCECVCVLTLIALFLFCCISKYLSISKVKSATSVEGDPKAPFSIATTLRCRGGHYYFP